MAFISSTNSQNKLAVHLNDFEMYIFFRKKEPQTCEMAETLRKPLTHL